MYYICLEMMYELLRKDIRRQHRVIITRNRYGNGNTTLARNLFVAAGRWSAAAGSNAVHPGANKQGHESTAGYKTRNDCVRLL